MRKCVTQLDFQSGEDRIWSDLWHKEEDQQIFSELLDVLKIDSFRKPYYLELPQKLLNSNSVIMIFKHTYHILMSSFYLPSRMFYPRCFHITDHKFIAHFLLLLHCLLFSNTNYTQPPLVETEGILANVFIRRSSSTCLPCNFVPSFSCAVVYKHFLKKEKLQH